MVSSTAKTLDSRRRPANGFTLIEAMIVVGIIAIVVALAYPTYIDSVRKARRADAESSLLAAAQLLERCFTRFNSYIADGCPDVEGPSQDGYYQITVVDANTSATTYEIQAAAQGDQTNDPCGNYSIDHLGNKLPPPSGNRCWGASS